MIFTKEDRERLERVLSRLLQNTSRLDDLFGKVNNLEREGYVCNEELGYTLQDTHDKLEKIYESLADVDTGLDNEFSWLENELKQVRKLLNQDGAVNDSNNVKLGEVEKRLNELTERLERLENPSVDTDVQEATNTNGLEFTITIDSMEMVTSDKTLPTYVADIVEETLTDMQE